MISVFGIVSFAIKGIVIVQALLSLLHIFYVSL